MDLGLARLVGHASIADIGLVVRTSLFFLIKELLLYLSEKDILSSDKITSVGKSFENNQNYLVGRPVLDVIFHMILTDVYFLMQERSGACYVA